MLDQARACGIAVSLERIALQDLPYRQHFDAVLTIDALENVPPEEWPLVLANLQRAVRPGGLLYLTVEEIGPSAIDAAFEALSREGKPAVRGEVVKGDVAGYHYYPGRDNQQGLTANARLDAAVVQDPNADARLPFGPADFDGVAICMSIQYLTQPVAVLREVGRVLRPGAPLVVTFSNRCFPTKAVTIWQALDDSGHARLVARYLGQAGNCTAIQALDRSPREPDADPCLRWWPTLAARTLPKRARPRRSRQGSAGNVAAAALRTRAHPGWGSLDISHPWRGTPRSSGAVASRS
jgi:ubiquinone/menaquinone biosynthesis C-methylase UbiE